MKSHFIAFAKASLFGMSILVMQPLAAADIYPDHPIRLVVPFPPGGAVDFLGRLLSAKLTDELRQPVILENRGGGNQVIATQLIARAAPDGYSLLLASATHAVNPALLKNLPYDTIKDFSPITLVAEFPNICVAHPSLGVKNIPELIALAKSRPGTIDYASSGTGSIGHLAVEKLKAMGGVDLLHVPYKGAGQAITDVLSGKVTFMCTSPQAALPHVRSGRLLALAMTGAGRSNVAPDLPTVAEQGIPGFYSASWFALLSPAATPRTIVDRLNLASVKILKLPDVINQLSSQAAQGLGLSPEDTMKFIHGEMARWAELIDRAGIKAE